jgi:hypothetical protein
MASGEPGEASGASLFGRMIAREEGDLLDFFGIGGSGAADDGQAAASTQVCFEWLERVNSYASLVEAPVGCIEFFCVDKGGSPLGRVDRRLVRRGGFRF